ncbi:uncharacterized protein J3D65DRAFT_627458 [Phyllosticta citribraziliensis]|uniref:Uncharacterized protein n=1 Tax=Phyllosticta citribraziliensis TaxID=989973 RepID=A0ABR1LLN3_9PEZI
MDGVRMCGKSAIEITCGEAVCILFWPASGGGWLACCCFSSFFSFFSCCLLYWLAYITVKKGMVTGNDMVEGLGRWLRWVCRVAVDLIHVRLLSVQAVSCESQRRQIAKCQQQTDEGAALCIWQLRRKEHARHGSKIGGDDKDVFRDHDRED